MLKKVEQAFPEEMRPAIEEVKNAVYTHIGDPYFIEMDADKDEYEIRVIHSVPDTDKFEFILYSSTDGLIRYKRHTGGRYLDSGAVVEDEQILQHVDPTGR